MADIDSLFLEESDNVRGRLLDGLPERWSSVEGTPARDYIELQVAEFTRTYRMINEYLAYHFLDRAWGPILDAHGVNYGVPRGQGTKASGIMRFSATDGTPVPVATLVGAPSQDPDEERPIYRTLNSTTVYVSSGFVDVAVEAVDVGVHANQPIGAVTTLETPNVSLTGLSNVTPMTGGSDPEDDETYREALKQAAALPAGSGTLRDHIAWALSRPGISDVAAYERWDLSGTVPGVYDGRENGSIILSVRGPAWTAVDWSELEDVQRYEDPDRQIIALLEEGEPWAVTTGPGAISWGTTDVQTGEKAMVITNGSATTTVAQLTRTMDLSRFGSDDDLYLWLKSDRWDLVAATTRVRFYTDDTNYYEATLANVAAGEPAKPSTDTDAWWRWRVDKGTFTVTGAPDWSAITKIEVALVTTGAALLTLDYWTFRSESGAIPEGQAPVGQAVTVVTPVPKSIDVTAKVELDAGYTLSGATGTTDAAAEIRAALELYFRTLKPGAPVRVSGIQRAISNVAGVVDLILRSPGGATVLNGAVTLPQATITVESTTDLKSNGSAWINDQEISYTGKTGTTLTGCTGGSGLQADNSVVRQSEIPVSVNQYAVLGTLTLT
jgi:uncharacterized phage protein gp47/JayE